MSDREIIETEIVEQMDNLPAVKEATALVARGEISVNEVVAQHDKIVQVMQAVMKQGVHYGIIPGVKKPSLFKAGAETINVALRLAPHYVSEKIWHEDGHLTVSAICTLRHIQTGLEIATGEGLCTSRESRYAYRQGGRVCPECGTDAIIKGKAEYGGGWICFAKKGGCGAKWPDDSEQAKTFETVEVGRIPNPDLADTFNTVLKMADKRALVAAVLNGTAASDVFTQDVEDMSSPEQPAPVEEMAFLEESKPFDPEKDLLPGAISGKDAPRLIADALHELEPTVDWQALIQVVVKDQYEHAKTSDWRELSPEDQRDFWRRLSNATHRMQDMSPPGSMPPIADDKIQTAFAFAFSGIAITVPVLPPPETDGPESMPEIDRDIPFGE